MPLIPWRTRAHYHRYYSKSLGHMADHMVFGRIASIGALCLWVTMSSQCADANESIDANTHDKVQSMLAHEPEALKHLKSMLAQYIGDPMYVYKLCGTCIVVLKRRADTQTNESRANIVDLRYAKHRGSRFDVEQIVDLVNIQPTQTAHSDHAPAFQYMVGKTVNPYGFDMDLDKVCAHGIHFYVDINPAFYHMGLYQRDKVVLQGIWKSWYPNGQPDCVYEFVDGKPHRMSYKYNDKGTLMCESFYMDGLRAYRYRGGEWVTEKW